MARKVGKTELEVIQKLRRRIDGYFLATGRSKTKVMQTLGASPRTLDNMFARNKLDVGFLALVCGELGVTFEELVWDAFNFDENPNVGDLRRIRQTQSLFLGERYNHFRPPASESEKDMREFQEVVRQVKKKLEKKGDGSEGTEPE